VDALNLTRDTSRNPLFDVWLDYHNFEIDSVEINLGGITLKGYPQEETSKQTKFDITIVVQELGSDQLGIYWEYNRDIYSSSQMHQMELHFSRVLQLLVENKETVLSELSVLESQDEQKQLALNPVEKSYDSSTALDQFSAVVKSQGSSIALIEGANKIIYQELDQQSNRLANYLLTDYGINKGDRVVIKLDRSIAQVVSVLGVLKTGAAYVPIDTSYPKERITYMEKDGGCKVVLDEEEWESFHLQRTLYPTQSPEVKITSQDAMYVIYTSGSTGNPKGCVLNYEGVSNYLDWTKEYVKDLDYSEVDFFSSLSFDFTVTSLFGALTQGKALRMYDAKEDLSVQLNRIALNPESGWIKLTPAHINLIDEQTLKAARSKVFVLGGEALTEEQINHLRKNEGCRIYNEYGPTEATVGCIVKEIDSDNAPYIGTPIPNTEAYLLDNSHNLVPYGSIGEICIGGLGLARGYLNREELTKEKFIDNPYKPGERLYRTGDLGRWREDGNLEYLGRIDDQVKIRGYRIELGEVEQALSSHPESKQAVVIARALNNITDKELIAYTTGEATAEELKAYLKEKLPSYMVPSYYVKLENIPLTSNGKVDRKNLPDPEGTGLKQGEYVAPSTEIETQLVKIWSELFNQNQISINTNFTTLGGHSIMAIRALSMIHKHFSITLSIRDVLENTLAEIAVKIEETITPKSGKKEMIL
jgi:amino acid adenylation domain-containing protein